MSENFLNDAFKKENRFFTGTVIIAGIIVGMLVLHYAFGFFPYDRGY